MKTISPREYREDMGRNRDGAMQDPPGRAEAREAHARRIGLHKLRYRARVKECIKKRLCPKCGLGQLVHHERHKPSTGSQGRLYHL